MLELMSCRVTLGLTPAAIYSFTPSLMGATSISDAQGPGGCYGEVRAQTHLTCGPTTMTPPP